VTTTIPTRSTTTVDHSRVARWKLSEPVRLYVYGLGSVIITGLVLAGVLSGEWTEYGLWALGTALGLGAAGESARASVYSTNGMVDRLVAQRAGLPPASPAAGTTLELGAPRRGSW
jgi:hypothetical protein